MVDKADAGYQGNFDGLVHQMGQNGNFTPQIICKRAVETYKKYMAAPTISLLRNQLVMNTVADVQS